MRELAFLVNSILKLAVAVFLLRLLLQLVRGDFRNPIAQAIVRLTNPVIVPLRRVLPPIGRVDTASVVAVLLAQLLCTVLVGLLGYGHLPPAGLLLIDGLVQVLDTTLVVFLFAVILYAVLSWVAPDSYNPATPLLDALVRPILRPLRRALPPFGGLDWSAFAACLLLILLQMILDDRIAPFLRSLL